VIVGELDPEAAAVIEEIARANRADIHRTSASDLGDWPVGLAGDHQRRNAAVAVRLLVVLDGRGIKVPEAAIRAALVEPRWPGRLDLRRLPDGRELLLDAAHNPAGAAALAGYLRSHEGPRLPLVFAAMRDKDAAAMFRELLPVVSSLTLTRAANPRSADPNELARTARTIAPRLPIRVEPSLDDSLDAAWRAVPPGSSRIVVAGSIFLLGDVLSRLGLHC
jgi:dihydrofolate synthase/folylpolyglutamate synthase